MRLPPLSASGHPRSRRIIIPVEVPRVQVVHTAELHLNEQESMRRDDGGTLVAVINEPMTAELQIKHTRIWDIPSLSNSLRSANMPDISPGAPLDFVYEVHCNPDIWLVGGRRRAYFTAKVCTTWFRLIHG
jgi:hypothetical protein